MIDLPEVGPFLLGTVLHHVIVEHFDGGEDLGAVLALVRALGVRHLLVRLHEGGALEGLVANITDVAETDRGGRQIRMLGLQMGLEGKPEEKLMVKIDGKN